MVEDGGLLLVLAGDGQTGAPVTAAAGMVLRALGQGLDVLVCPLAEVGEGFRPLARTKDLPGRLTVWPCPGNLDCMLAALAGEITAGRHDMIVLQSVERIQANGLEMQLTGLLDCRPPGLHMVLTGQGGLGGLVDTADLVTRFERQK